MRGIAKERVTKLDRVETLMSLSTGIRDNISDSIDKLDTLNKLARELLEEIRAEAKQEEIEEEERIVLGNLTPLRSK